jgi:hypothetical protein
MASRVNTVRQMQNTHTHFVELRLPRNITPRWKEVHLEDFNKSDQNVQYGWKRSL